MQQNSPKPFKASNYKLKMYERCPRLYFFEYLDEDIAPIKKQIKQKRPPLEVGNLVHDILFKYYKVPQAQRSAATLLGQLKSAWPRPFGSDWGFANLEEERMWYQDTVAMLKMFYEKQQNDEHLFYVPDPYSRELTIDIPLEQGLMLTGRVDRIDEEGDALHVVDYKTGKSEDDDEFQVMTYVLLAKQKFGREVTKASYFYLRTGQMKTFTPSYGAEQVTAERIRRLVETIKLDTQYVAKPSRLCQYCDFLEYCPAKKEVMELLKAPKEANEFDEPSLFAL